MYFRKHNQGENNMNHEQIWHAIDMFAKEHHMSCSGLAKCSGLDPTIFNKSKRFSKYEQPRWPSTNSIAKIISATNSTPQDFFKFIKNNDPSD